MNYRIKRRMRKAETHNKNKNEDNFKKAIKELYSMLKKQDNQ